MSTTAAAQPIREARETPGGSTRRAAGTITPQARGVEGSANGGPPARPIAAGAAPRPAPWEAACTPDARGSGSVSNKAGRPRGPARPPPRDPGGRAPRAPVLAGRPPVLLQGLRGHAVLRQGGA